MRAQEGAGERERMRAGERAGEEISKQTEALER